MFNVIDLPLFLYLGLTLFTQIINTQSFYLDYVIYFGIGGFVIGAFLQGFAGFRAAKDKSSNVKPWIAGLSTALIVGIFSLILSVVMIVYFPTPIGDLTGMNIDTQSEEIIIEDEEFDNEEIIVKDDFGLNEMGKGGWDDPLLSWTLIGGGIGVLFSSLWGALCGLIGGAIGKD